METRQVSLFNKKARTRAVIIYQ